MKYLRKCAQLTVFLIGIFMVISFVWGKKEDEKVLQPNQEENDFNEGWYVELPYAESEVILPYTEKHPSSDTIILQKQIPEDFASATIRFSVTNADVRVLLDGEEIYSRKQENGSVATEHFMSIPALFSNGKLQIELTVLQKDAEITLGEIIIENHGLTLVKLGVGTFGNIVCCLVIMIAAVVMFVLELLRRCTGWSERGELFLGMFGLMESVSAFIGTNTLHIFFFNTQSIYHVQEYINLLLPLVLAFYFDRNLRAVYPHRFVILLYGTAFNAGIQIFLQWTGRWDLKDMEGVSKVVMIVVCLAAVVSLMQLDHKKWRYEIQLAVILVTVLLSGEAVKLRLNTLSVYVYGNRAEIYGITFFCVMAAVMHIQIISREYQAEAEERIKTAEKQSILLAREKKKAETARQEALVANEAKGKFLAHMSHEIRTPINAVLGMDEMILRETEEQNIKEYAMDIYSAGQMLLSLINDILDFSKLESGKMELVLVSYDISSLIHDLVNMISQRAEAKGLRLEIEIDQKIPSRLYGDDVRIRQVLTNILTNAVKYTHEGTVWLRVQSRSAGEITVLRFEVEDTGIGIKEEDLPKLTAEFERIEEDRNRNVEGSGLGMSITIQLLNLMGSKLEIESVYGKGSKFYFELEQKIVDCEPIGDFASNVLQIANDYCYDADFYAPDAKILVVDDNAVNRKVLRNLLKETQVQITDADGGAQCLNLIQKNHYDLIFLDYMMPEMDGVETLHHIKDMSECLCKDTPIIVLTANAVAGAKEKYLSEGFDDFLSKPVSPKRLEDMIRNYLPKNLLLTAVDSSKEIAKKTEKDSFLERLPLVEGLDWDYAWLHLPNQELLQNTVKEFYAQIDSAAKSLEQLYIHILDKGQMEQYCIQVHAMKSLAATVGIVTLFGMARVLEYAAKDNRVDIIMSMTTVFLEEWRSYQQKLQGVFGIGTTVKEMVSDYSVIRALVEMVRVNMQEIEFDAADEAMAQLQAYEYPDEIRKNIQMLAEAVTNLNQEETEHIAILLLKQMANEK